MMDELLEGGDRIGWKGGSLGCESRVRVIVLLRLESIARGSPAPKARPPSVPSNVMDASF